MKVKIPPNHPATNQLQQQNQLKEQRYYIHLYGPITPISIQRLTGSIIDAMNESANAITIFLSSEGGDLNSGFTAYNFLRALTIPVTVCNMGSVESIAMMVYLGAQERLAIHHSRFLLHSFHWNLNGGVDRSRLLEHSGSLDFDSERYCNIFNDRTQGAETPINVREALAGKAVIVDAATAITSGIATSISDASGIISAAMGKSWYIPIPV